jgi:hypothetical protein
MMRRIMPVKFPDKDTSRPETPSVKAELDVKPTPQVPATPLPSSSALRMEAKYRQIAYLLATGQKMKEIATEVDRSERQLRRMLVKPEFQAIYKEVATEFFGDLDKMMKDESIRPLIRAQAQSARGQTLITNIMNEIQERIDTGMARSTDMKVGLEAALGIIDRAKGELSNAPGGGASVTIEQFNVDNSKKLLIKNTIEEAGLDLSDIMPTIDVSVTEDPVEDDE